MNNFKNMIKLLISKREYISDLCGDYGNPEDVYNHLQDMINHYPFLSIYLKSDMENLKKDMENFKQSLKCTEQDYSSQGGCYDCPYGNGEGTCTVHSCFCC